MPKIEDLIKANPNHLHGIDISSYQGNASSLKWDKIKNSGVSFVYCKATEGVTIQDKQFRENYKNLATAGIPRGAYHFFRGGNSGARQLDNFMAQIIDLWRRGDMPPTIDVEAVHPTTPLTKQIDYILDWCYLLQTSLRVKPLIYTSLRVIRDLFGNTTAFKDLQLWTVDYRTGVTEPRLPPGFTDWKLWQFSDKAIVPSISGTCDIDRLNGLTTEDLQEFIDSSYLP